MTAYASCCHTPSPSSQNLHIVSPVQDRSPTLGDGWRPISAQSASARTRTRGRVAARLGSRTRREELGPHGPARSAAEPGGLAAPNHRVGPARPPLTCAPPTTTQVSVQDQQGLSSLFKCHCLQLHPRGRKGEGKRAIWQSGLKPPQWLLYSNETGYPRMNLASLSPFKDALSSKYYISKTAETGNVSKVYSSQRYLPKHPPRSLVANCSTRNFILTPCGSRNVP